MKLTPEQDLAISQWLAEGASIAEVQKRLRDEYQVALTFMDTRFLIDDLGLNLKETPRPPDPNLKAAADPAARAAGDAELVGDDVLDGPADDDFGDDLLDEPGGGGKVTVEVDRIMRPGTTVSGSVSFSDGNSGKWALDQYGRIVFEGAASGYRPSEADLKAFQRELSAQLQRQGF